MFHFVQTPDTVAILAAFPFFVVIHYYWNCLYNLLPTVFLNPFSRFVADVPLASTKTSNYYNAISMALKLLTDMQNNRDTHVSSVNHDVIQYIHNI